MNSLEPPSSGGEAIAQRRKHRHFGEKPLSLASLPMACSSLRELPPSTLYHLCLPCHPVTLSTLLCFLHSPFQHLKPSHLLTCLPTCRPAPLHLLVTRSVETVALCLLFPVKFPGPRTLSGTKPINTDLLRE